MSAPHADIAVVVPAGGRTTRLAFLLDALAEQTISPARFEVVVVGDERAPLETTPRRDPFRVRYLTADSRWPGVKRDLGWRSTDAPLIAFTDDDCRPSPRWLEQLGAAADEDTFVQGRTEPDPDERHLLRVFARTRLVDGPSPWYPGCNMAYPRALLERLGGFDQAFTLGAEDTDLALRAARAGARCRYVDDAVVWHAVLPPGLLHAVRAATAERTFALLFARYPAYRRHLYLRVFRNRMHATLLLALAGLLLLRRRPGVAAIAAGPYLHERLAGSLVPGRRNPRAVARLLLNLPSRLLVDLTEIGATTARAASQRVAVL